MTASPRSSTVGGFTWPVERSILAGFGLALLILIAISAVAYQATLSVAPATTLRDHSDQVRFDIQTLLSQLQDAETGQRGFLITGDDTYLAPYHTAVAAVAGQAAGLRALTAGNPAQQQLLDALDPLIADKLAELQQTIDLRRRQGFAAAQALVVTNRGQQTMDQIRATLGAMQTEEESLFQARDAALARQLVVVRWVAAGGGALAVGIVLLALAVIRRELRQRQAAQAALAREHELLQVLMDNIPDTLYFKDRQSRFVRINRAQAQVLGLADPAAAAGKTDFDFQPEAVSRPSFAREQEVIASGQPLIDWIEFVPTAKGAPRWFSSTKIPIRDAAGQITGLVGLSRDVTAHQQAQAALQAEIADRKRAEAEVHALNQELAQKVVLLDAANRELEAFSYSVSHDLRAPLRALDGFSQILLEDYAGQVDAAGQDYLQRVRAASQKMGELIDALLTLARLTRAEMRREPLDLTALAQTAVAELRAGEPRRQVDVVIASGLSATGDPRLLRAVLDNLLGNAWKFTSKTASPRIEFGRVNLLTPASIVAPAPAEASTAPAAPELVFFVRDNGAGFDMAHTDRLFGAFQRLHGQAEFSGSGIGLATVQRIIQRHGGRVWAEGQPGAGATFYFTLPASEDASSLPA